MQELAARAASYAKAEAAKHIAPPNSAYQFEVSWRGLSGDRNLQVQLLKVSSNALIFASFSLPLHTVYTISTALVLCLSTAHLLYYNLFR